jgi:hypothetical protein
VVPVFVTELRAGLSYQRFIAALFLAALETRDPHQVAQVHGAHGIAGEARLEERLLPLFWALDRVNGAHQSPDPEHPPAALRELRGPLPEAARAAAVLAEALRQSDADQTERAAMALARDQGPRSAMARLWEFGGRDPGGTLGHAPIALANGWRTLDAMGWRHAEPLLRYAARMVGGRGGDGTYAPNLERARRTAPRLPAGWARLEGRRPATLEIYGALREGDAAGACDGICARLASGEATAGSIWDAISLAAADLVHRHALGGLAIGSVLIHAITATNALRFGFHVVDDPGVRLLNLLQAAGFLADFFVRQARKEGRLRDRNLLDLQAGEAAGASLGEVFALLPFKSHEHRQEDPAEREASDAACRLAFTLLGDPGHEPVFLAAARGFVCAKASQDPHDIKYPAAAFEDAYLVNPEWRRYLLASTVHALHGARSADAVVLVQAREALR